MGHVRGVAASLETVRAACGNVQADRLVVAEFEALPVPVRWLRTTPRVERDRLCWTNAAASIPALRSTSASTVRQKEPRSSTCGVGRNSRAPAIRGTRLTSTRASLPTGPLMLARMAKRLAETGRRPRPEHRTPRLTCSRSIALNGAVKFPWPNTASCAPRSV